jgi:hypothetical protein
MTEAQLRAALDDAPVGRAVVLVGGAEGAADAELARIRGFLATLVDHLERTETVLLDGGTDTGVIGLVGDARAAAAASFRLIGVVPAGVLERPTRNDESIRLEPGHDEILLVPGDTFGDETPWLFGAADLLNAGPAPTIVVNGGAITMAEARLRLDGGHVVVAVAGSGRTADALANDTGLRRSGRLRVVDLAAAESEIAAALDGALR